jgi:Tol biopolymer transport system component
MDKLNKFKLFAFLSFLIILLCPGCGEQGNFNWRPDPSFTIDRKANRILIAWSTNDSSYLASYDLKKRKLKVLCTDTKWICYPSVSRNGSRIVFSKIDPVTGDGHIFVSHRDGTGQKQLTTGDYCDLQPVFSSDGQHVYFTRALEQSSTGMGGIQWGDWDLFKCGLNGGRSVQVTRFDANQDAKPLVSRSGEVLYGFCASKNGQSDVYDWSDLSSAGTRHIKWLTSFQVCLSPDDGGLYYLDGTSYDPDIWKKIDAKSRQITNVRIYIQQFEVLNSGHMIVLGMPYRDDKRHDSPEGATDTDEALMEIYVPSQSTKTLVSVEQLANPES